MEKIPHEIIGKAITDPEFRQQLLNDPDAAIAVSGYELDEDQMEALRNLDSEAVDRAIEELVGSLDSAKWA